MLLRYLSTREEEEVLVGNVVDVDAASVADVAVVTGATIELKKLFKNRFEFLRLFFQYFINFLIYNFFTKKKIFFQILLNF